MLSKSLIAGFSRTFGTLVEAGVPHLADRSYEVEHALGGRVVSTGGRPVAEAEVEAYHLGIETWLAALAESPWRPFVQLTQRGTGVAGGRVDDLETHVQRLLAAPLERLDHDDATGPADPGRARAAAAR